MKSTFISKENNDVKFTMEFTAEEFEAAVVKAYQQNKDQFQIDGFRKGKAPRSIIERKYGEGVFYEEAINNLFSESYPEALSELDIEVVDHPRAEFSEIKKGQPFTVTITVATFPIVEVKDYKGVEVTQEKAEVSDEDVNREIENLQKRNARVVSVERPAKDGDTVILDYSGFVGEEQFEGGTAERQELKLGSGMFIPGFEEQLVGVGINEKKDVVVTFPEEYHAPDLAGKEAVFHCLIHEIKEEQLPELDDEFAKDVSEYDTLDELKEANRAKLQEYAELQAVNKAKDAVVEKIYESNDVDVPAVMIDDEIDQMSRELDQQLRYQGLALDQYLKYMDKTPAEFREELKPEAEKKVKTRIILRSIIAAEGITASEEEVESELAVMAQAYGMVVEDIKKNLGEENLKYFKKDVEIKKVIDMLYDEAKVTK